VAGNIPACGHRDSDRAQEHTDEARQTQETAGTIHCTFDLRAGVGDIAQTLTALLVIA